MAENSKLPKRLLTHARKAEQLSVTTKTIDRWVAAKILSKPVIINGRKFHDADEQPRSSNGAGEAA